MIEVPGVAGRREALAEIEAKPVFFKYRTDPAEWCHVRIFNFITYLTHYQKHAHGTTLRDASTY